MTTPMPPAYPLGPPHGSPPPRPSRPGWLIPVLAAAVVLVLAAGGTAVWALTRDSAPVKAPAAAPTSASVVTLAGELRISIYAHTTTGGPCVPNETGYADIRQGAQVTVTDSAGKVLALGQLDAGTVKEDPTLAELSDCVFSFRVSGVPLGAGIYGVEVSHRGKIQVPEADLGKPVELTLGT